MADCVHIACKEFISCRKVPGQTGSDVGMCEYCQTGVVYVPADMLWVLANGRVREKAVCRGKKSPDRKHWVRK